MLTAFYRIQLKSAQTGYNRFWIGLSLWKLVKISRNPRIYVVFQKGGYCIKEGEMTDFLRTFALSPLTLRRNIAAPPFTYNLPFFLFLALCFVPPKTFLTLIYVFRKSKFSFFTAHISNQGISLAFSWKTRPRYQSKTGVVACRFITPRSRRYHRH